MLWIAVSAFAFATSAGVAISQEKKTLAIVVKGLDNPFFTVLGDGCAKWNEENGASEYECVYTGPASSSDEAGEVQLVQELIAQGAAGVAISPSNAPAMAEMLRAQSPEMPIVTIDADLLPADRDLRSVYLGTDNYDMGARMAEHLKSIRPDGGMLCLQLGNVAAANINERAAGFRDTISAEKGLGRLNGEGGWTEIDGCPLYTNDDTNTAVQQFADVSGVNPDLNAFVLVGGWAQFDAETYAAACEQLKPRLESNELVIVAGDLLPPQVDALKAGCSHVQVGQRPFEIGHDAPDVLIRLINGETVEDPIHIELDECTQENADSCVQG